MQTQNCGRLCDGVTHYYTYEGINLIKEEWNGNVMLFLYDADGSS